MASEQVTVAVAFGAGVISFISPCVLPLVPAYVTNLAGVSLAGGTPAKVRLGSVSHALAFVAGFTAVFVLIWTSIGLVGYLVLNYLPYVRFVGGSLLIFMGFHVMGIWRIPFLEQEMRSPFSLRGRVSYRRSFLLGLLFAAGWTPCIGPVLAGIIGLASLRHSVWQGSYLLLVYSVGLGIPFLATALAINPVTSLLWRIGRYQRALSLLAGVFIIVVGILMMTNAFAGISRYFNWGAI